MSDTQNQYPFSNEAGYDDPQSAEDLGDLVARATIENFGAETLDTGSQIKIEDQNTEPQLVAVHTGSGPHET